MADPQKAPDSAYPPNVLPYPTPYSPFPPPPPGYPPFFAYPPPHDPPHDPQQNPPPPPPYMMAFPGMVYPYPPPQGAPFPPPPSSASPALTKPKRKQVKMACTNCAAACKRCDENRPCERCIKYGMTGSCVDGQRKERKKGIKRGPYKRKNKSSENAASYTSESSAGQPPPSAPPPSALPVPHQFAPEGFYQALYYGPPGPFITHPPDSQQSSSEGPSAQPPHHPGAPPHVGVNGQPVLPPYFYAYPPFSHYPPMFPPLPGLPPPGSQPPPSQPQPPLPQQPPAEVPQPVSTTPPQAETQKTDGQGEGASDAVVEKAAMDAAAAINASIGSRKRKRGAAKLINGQQKRAKVMTRSTSSAIKEGVVRPEDLEGDGSSGGEKLDVDAEGEDEEGNGDEDGNGSGDESSV